MPVDVGDLLDRIEGSREAMISLARRLVAIPTENPPGDHYAECAALLAGELEQLGLAPEIIKVPPDGSRRIVSAGIGAGPTLYLHGHYDVVPGSGPQQFVPKIVDGRLIGRGAADMKAALAAMVYALAALRDEPLAGRVELVMVPDEETGGERGSGYLARTGRLGRHGIGAIVGEPTGGVVWNASRGAVTLRVRLRGKPAHVGLQHEGRNAFEAAAPVLRALTGLKEQVERRCSDHAAEPEEARASILMLGGEVRGGHQFNVVPAEFSFTIERRFNPEENLAVERERLLDTIHGSVPPDINLSIETIQEGDSSSIAPDAALARAISSATEAVGVSAPRFTLCPGLLETRFYTACGVEALAYGPGELSVSHGPAEYVELQRVVDCAKVYAAAAVTMTRRARDGGEPRGDDVTT